jgi:exodeoxyribonuclease VII large subunit
MSARLKSMRRIVEVQRDLRRAAEWRRAELERRLAALQPGPRISRAHQELGALVARRDTAMTAQLERRRRELGRLGAQMAALSPLAVLDRGFAMVQRGADIVRDAAQVAAGDRLRVRLARGALGVIVEEVDEP